MSRTTWSIDRELIQDRERQIDLTGALLARLRGEEPRGRYAAYRGCSFADLELLANIRLPRVVRLGGTTGDWPVILTDAFEARLLDYYRAASPTYRALTTPVSLSSYRPATLARPGEYPTLRQVGEGGEVEQGIVTDGGERLALLRFARIFGVTRIAITNDDIAALNVAAEQAAQAALFAQDQLFCSTLTANGGLGPTLLDGVAFFDASRGNVMSAASISTTSVGLALAAMRKQTAPGGAKLNVTARFLLCAPDNEGAARLAIAALTVGTTPPLELLVDANLSGNGWYLFADSSTRAGFARGFLFDRETPFVSKQDGFEIDGVRWKVWINFGIAPFDPRAVVRNPGA
jgi:hypothetical protein